MIQAELSQRLTVEPFEPFCIELLNGRRVNVFDPRSASVLTGRLFIADTTTGGWCVIPLQAIALIESLLEAFTGGQQPASGDDGK